MKSIILLITSITLANLVGAGEKLTIAPAHALPDYTKFIAAAGNSNRLFLVAFAAGDFNKDGRPDLVVQTGDPSGYPFLPFGAQVFLQETNGTFAKGTEQMLPNTGITWDFVTRDFNEDGNLDILMEDSDNDMVMLLGNGDGTFQPPGFLGLSAAGYFAVANLDGDNHLDLVAGRLDGTVGVYAGGGDGTFSLKATLDTKIKASYPRFGETLIGDVNGDGKLDVAVASVLNNSTSQPGNLDVFLGNGDGTFQAVVRTPGVAVRRGALGDFNGDGKLDYAGDRGSPEQLEIWLGNGNGKFAKHATYSLSGIYSLAYGVKVGDVNSDGIQDVIVGGETSGSAPVASLSIFLGNGTGTFRPRIAFTQANGALPQNTGPQLLDFNGDGMLDVLNFCWLTTRPTPEDGVMTIALCNGVKRDPKLGFLLSLEMTEPAISIKLQESTNLTDWIDVATVCCGMAAGKWWVTDTNGGSSQYFYTVRRGGFTGGH